MSVGPIIRLRFGRPGTHGLPRHIAGLRVIAVVAGITANAATAPTPANELEHFKQAAAAGDSQAALKLSAHFYFYEQNHEAGLYWHIKAAELGHLQAQANLAHIFFDQYQTDRQAATLHNAEKWAQAALKNGAGADINELLQNIRVAKAR